jgi:hypothetical protein
MAVFLLILAHICMKTGLKNSYALRVPLSGIFERTRDLRPRFITVQTQIGQDNYTFAFSSF